MVVTPKISENTGKIAPKADYWLSRRKNVLTPQGRGGVRFTELFLKIDFSTIF